MWINEDTLEQRFGSLPAIHQAETELRLNPHSCGMTDCPARYSEAGDAHFVLVKTGESRYRYQFFLCVHEQFCTGVEEYGDLTECVVTRLQVQAGHEAQRHAKRS